MYEACDGGLDVFSLCLCEMLMIRMFYDMANSERGVIIDWNG